MSGRKDACSERCDGRAGRPCIVAMDMKLRVADRLATLMRILRQQAVADPQLMPIAVRKAQLHLVWG